MKRLLYSPDYREKILQLRKDLDLRFDQKTRKKVLSEIDHRLHLLQTQNYLGISLREMFGINCDYYYIYIAHNYIFYEVENDAIYIINMYNEREDFLVKFLGSSVKLHESSSFDPDTE